MNSNDYQIGGNHYASEYQHWDFVCDTKLHYLLGCATKYVSRWRKKNGIEDLKKALHYLRKAKENRIYAEKDVKIGTEEALASTARRMCWDRFISQHESLEDRNILTSIRLAYSNDYSQAEHQISKLIEETKLELEAGPGRSYVDPDSYFRG